MTSTQRQEPMSWGEIAGFALLAGVVGLLVFSGRDPVRELVATGTPLPPLMAEGWLNSEGPPSSSDLKQRVVVVDCWATWCPPCRAAMPKLAKLYAKYQPLGVEFIGLTSETARDRATIESFISNVDGFNWPVGYGARPTLDMLAITGLPTVIVFESGRAVWSGHELYDIEAALDQALANVEIDLRTAE